MDPLKTLRAKVAASTQSAVARELGVSRQYIQQVIDSERPLSDGLLERLGYERVTTYRRRKDAQNGSQRASRRA